MPIPTDNSWRFRLKRTDSGGSYLKYNSTLKNTGDLTAVVGTAPTGAITKAAIVSTIKTVVRSI